MPDAVALPNCPVEHRPLDQYVTNYKVSKAKENFDFVQESFDEAKIDFESTQEKPC
jgi:hypothetical protein